MPKAFSSDVAAGSREEGASRKDARLDLFGFVPFRLNRGGIYNFRYSRSRRVCVRLTGISVAFSSFIRRM